MRSATRRPRRHSKTRNALARRLKYETLESRRLLAAEITGRIFDDANGDGVRSQDEPGLANWTVFLDTDGNGDLDPGEASTTPQPCNSRSNPARRPQGIADPLPFLSSSSLAANAAVVDNAPSNLTLAAGYLMATADAAVFPHLPPTHVERREEHDCGTPADSTERDFPQAAEFPKPTHATSRVDRVVDAALESLLDDVDSASDWISRLLIDSAD